MRNLNVLTPKEVIIIHNNSELGHSSKPFLEPIDWTS
jgi:hypothetical protein